mgnify:CR=1 FL=1
MVFFVYLRMDYNSGQYEFKKDISTGVKGENQIRGILESRGFKFINSCQNNSYDLKMSYGDKEYTYEIKTDVYPRDTGNLVVEFESRGKSSGIAVTNADFFVTFFPRLGEIWNIRTEDLRGLISKINPVIFENSGDANSKTRLYKLKKSEVRQFFKIHSIAIEK